MKKGMTLTEILIVVSIIAFLFVLVTAYLRTQVFKGNDAKRKSDLNRLSIALEEYEKDNNCYPPSNLITCDPGTNLQPYLNKIPCDPTTEESYSYEVDISNPTCPKWYRIYSKLENEEDSDYIANIGPSSEYSYYQGSPNAPEVVSSSGSTVEYFGCFSGVCSSISGPICEPNYQISNCNGQCSLLINECVN